MNLKCFCGVQSSFKYENEYFCKNHRGVCESCKKLFPDKELHICNFINNLNICGRLLCNECNGIPITDNHAIYFNLYGCSICNPMTLCIVPECNVRNLECITFINNLQIDGRKCKIHNDFF
jgi:hypothetical protein